ncbi:MAG: hypothetical protein HOP29_03065 [Phycisphaerales bacterium]|nr:hypothetical protein [Phycisphaerales bacterium]
MLRFRVYQQGKPVKNLDLSGAYLFGSDGVPLRADLNFADGVITCTKRATGPAGLALLWPVDGAGRLLLETTRLTERDEPFVLNVELARGQLMRISHKSEDWGLFDCADARPLNEDASAATDLLIRALQADDPAVAAQRADESLGKSIRAGEAMTAFHAGVLLERRKQTAGFTRRVFGCHADPAAVVDTGAKLLAESFDFVTLPFAWKQIEPKEQAFNYKPLDTWVEWFSKNHIPMKGASLVSFQENAIPDWLYIWEHDFETVRDLVAEHIRRIVNRYGRYIQVWDVISGVHGIQGFSFNFEQLIELTRVAATVTRQVAPRCVSIIELIAPWGEYYARNQRTIPPMLYAEMLVQSGIQFDALGLQFCFGAGVDGMFVRDMLQISALMDKFGGFGKPVHLTAVQVPSAVGKGVTDPPGGVWRHRWNESVQSQWLREFYTIALSKPFVETVSWRSLADVPGGPVPHGGLLKTDLARKEAFNSLAALRRDILPNVAPE